MENTENLENQEEKANFYSDYRNLMESIGVLQKNEKGFNYNYLDYNKLWDSVEQKIKDFGFILISTVEPSDKVVSRKSKDSEYTTPIYELHAQLRHLATNTCVDCWLPLSVDDIDPQAYGSAMTYMRRYAIFVLLNIKTEDDDGAKASARDKRKQEEKEPLPADVNEIASFLAHQENPKIYYHDVKNRADIPFDLKRKLNNIMYPQE